MVNIAAAFFNCAIVWALRAFVNKTRADVFLAIIAASTAYMPLVNTKLAASIVRCLLTIAVTVACTCLAVLTAKILPLYPARAVVTVTIRAPIVFNDSCAFPLSNALFIDCAALDICFKISFPRGRRVAVILLPSSFI